MARLLVFLAALVHLQASLAQTRGYEITPFIGWRTSSSLEEENTGVSIDLKETRSFGIILSMRQKKDSNYDFLFSRQITELQSSTSPANTTSLRFDYYHVGGSVFYHHDNLHPFISGGLGATHVAPADDVFSSDTMFSLSVGGGLRFPISQNVGLRLEVRGYGTVSDGSGGILCANGACVAKFTGSLFVQVEASAGLSIAF